MDINRANMDSLFREYEVSFTDGFNRGNEATIYRNLAMVVPSVTEATVHAWLNQIPQMREWVGDRVVNNLRSNKLTVLNKKFESTVEMPRESIEDDQYGLYTPLIELMGENAAIFPDKEIVDVMVANGDWGGDDDAFFKADRAYGDNTIANYVTTALAEGTLETAVETIASYKGQNDEPLNVRPYAVVVGPSKRTTVFDLLKNDMRATAATDGVSVQNRNKGIVTPYISSRLVGDYANDWFVLGEMGGIRPIAWQNRMNAELQSQRWTPDSELAFEKDLYQIGARRRGAAFLTLPHLAYAGLVSQA